MTPCRLLHVINNLHLGGAETMLVRLLGRLDRDRWSPQVVSLVGGGPAADQLRAIGVPVTCIGMRRGLPGPRTLARLTRAMSRSRPDLVQTWLYHSDLLGGLASKVARTRAPVVWNLRMNGPTRGRDKATTLWTARACAILSKRIPARIVVNSESGRKRHIELGYDAGRIEVIRNGFDVERFRPSESARQSIRSELGLGSEARLVGMAARWDPLKDFPTMIRAASGLLATCPELHVLLCGPGVDRSNLELAALIETRIGASLSDRLHLQGRRVDMPTWQAALDVAVLASWSEGFPNAMGEAMSCGVPCVATDAGGSSEVLGETGRLVGVGDASGLESAIFGLLTEPEAVRRELGRLGRERIVSEFSLDRMVERFESSWNDVLGEWSRKRNRSGTRCRLDETLSADCSKAA